MTKEMKKELENLGQKVLQDIEKKENPSIEIPIRALSNVIFDKKAGQLTLGDKTSKRYYFNVAHAKKFMQTLMVASFSKQLIDQNIHASIRDMYYNLKRTLPNSDENTFDEQSESVCPDEPLLVRIGGEFKIASASEVVEYAEKFGKKIYDKDGKKKFVDADIKVCAFDKNYKIKEQKVSMVMRHPTNKVKEIMTSSGRRVKVTQSHSLFTNSYGEPEPTKTSELKIGDWIALPRKIEIETTNYVNVFEGLMKNCPDNILKEFYIKSDKKTIREIINRISKPQLKEIVLKLGYKNSWSDTKANWIAWNTIPIKVLKLTNCNIDDLLFKIKIGRRGSRHYYNSTIGKDENFGFVMGLLMSEGSHSLFAPRKSYFISVSNKSKELLNHFMFCFEKSFGSHCASKCPMLGKDNVHELNVGYDTLSHLLTYVIGYKPCNAWDKELPYVILDAPEICVKSFLKSFRLGDGSVYIPKFRIRYHTSSKNLVNGLIFLLLRLGIFGRIYNYKKSEKNPLHHDMYEIRIGNRECTKLLAEITGDKGFENSNHNISSDRIPNIGMLIKEARMSCKNSVDWKHFSWNYIEDINECISRPVLSNALIQLQKFSADSRLVSNLESIEKNDIFWDKITAIEDAPAPEYTVDLSVDPTENFIGGTGFIILHNSDPIIVDLEVAIDVLREQLHLTTDRKGIVAGNVKIQDRGDIIDWSKLGSGGWSIPSTVDEVDFKKVDAEFVLVVEKNAGFERLHEDKFWQKHNCILIGTGGQPSRGTRLLIQRLNNEHKLPVYVFCDSDSYGFYIYSVIKSGSISLAHVSDRISTPSARYLGLTVSDIYEYDLKKAAIKAKAVDIKRAKELLNYEWFKKNPKWQKEINLLIEKGIKAEIEALSHRGLKFMSEEYLPEKLKKKDFLD
ncbi:MAG: LAGLIDADG family homing endonuclease [Candidatus Aenigmatarchaeota archaeon]